MEVKEGVRERPQYEIRGEQRIELKRRATDGKYYPFNYLVCAGKGGEIMAHSHIHNLIELLYCISGEADVWIGKSRYDFAKGDLVVINPGELHMVKAKGERTTVYSVVQFDPELLRLGGHSSFDSKYVMPHNLSSPNGRRVFSKDVLGAGFVRNTINNIAREYVDKKYGFELSVRADISRLFLRILRVWHKENSIRNGLGYNENENSRRMERVFEYVEQCFAGEVTAEDAARICGMSYSYFSRFFKSTVGMSFTKYLNSVRVLKSADLLARTDKSITEIAMEVGFSTTSYFIARFREEKHMSPGEFRKQTALEKG